MCGRGEGAIGTWGGGLGKLRSASGKSPGRGESQGARYEYIKVAMEQSGRHIPRVGRERVETERGLVGTEAPNNAIRSFRDYARFINRAMGSHAV